VPCVISAVFFLAVLTLLVSTPEPCGRRKDKEAETKANCHTIQITLERYFTDHGEYPPYLLGGDIDGWAAWHEQWDGLNEILIPDGRIASNNVVCDPLIQEGYITSYPFNPFVGDGSRVIRATNVQGVYEDGLGDPRFGYKGNVMGQGLDDPSFFCGAIQPEPYNWSEIETRRTLDHGDWMNVPDAFKNTENMYYLFGGWRNDDPRAKDEVVYTHWPGNFFYRAASEAPASSDGKTLLPPNTHRGGPYTRFILGGYGAERTVGMDIIRLEPFDPDGNRVSWRTPDEFGSDLVFCGYEYFTGEPGQSGGLPEVFGGGADLLGPCWPYDMCPEAPGEFIFGAPDGTPDGVIIVLSSETPRSEGYVR
jgi:hypothetical protein